MSEYATTHRSAYTVHVQGRLPADLADKISHLHATALVDRRSPQTHDDDLEAHGNGDAGPQNRNTNTG